MVFISPYNDIGDTAPTLCGTHLPSIQGKQTLSAVFSIHLNDADARAWVGWHSVSHGIFE